MFYKIYEIILYHIFSTIIFYKIKVNKIINNLLFIIYQICNIIFLKYIHFSIWQAYIAQTQ